MNFKEANFNQLVRYSVNQGELPRYLYKYRQLENFTDQIFTNSQLWFSTPPALNDPFDCQITIDTNNTPQEIANFLRLNAPSMPINQVIYFSEQWSQNPSGWKQMVRETVQGGINEKGVCCFAGHNDSILMWSHYTDSHKGICLKFDVLADTDFFSVPIIVKYRKDYPDYNHVRDNSKLIEHLMQTKSNVWHYEDEVRVLKFSFGAYAFKKEALTEVCFGCNCSKSEIYRITDLATSSGFKNLLFTKAEKFEKKYGLVIKNL
jgi:hypothetical protein